MNFTKLLLNKEPKTFLIGAGCSIDPPSNLPAGRSMMEAIIKTICSKSEISKILQIDGLRFEELVEILRDYLDPELKIIEYYSQCEIPNLQHFYLADMAINDHYIMTTNFDFLIEYALLNSNISKNQIIPVITEKDYNNFNDPKKLIKQGKKLIYKIHGSIKNIITLEDTRSSLFATIQAFGQKKEGLNVFQVEPFKRSLFNNIMKKRTLIVMGYSGSDDFDIKPTLDIIKTLKKIIWINFDPKNLTGTITKIDGDYIKKYDKNNQLDNILVDLYKMGKLTKTKREIYKVEVNISKFLENNFRFDVSDQKSNHLDPISWIKENLPSPSKFTKLAIPCKIFYNHDQYAEALLCAKKLLRIAEDSKNSNWKARALHVIGQIHTKEGSYSKGARNYQQAINIFDAVNNLEEKAKSMIRLVELLRLQQAEYDPFEDPLYSSNPIEAQMKRKLNEALELSKQIEKPLLIAQCLSLMPLPDEHDLYRLSEEKSESYLDPKTGEYDIEKFFGDLLAPLYNAIKIFEENGALIGKARCLLKLGLFYLQITNLYEQGFKAFKEGTQIADLLGHHFLKAEFKLYNSAMILRNKLNAKINAGFKSIKESLEIFQTLGSNDAQIWALKTLGFYHIKLNNLIEAKETWKIAFKIAEDLELDGQITAFNIYLGLTDSQWKEIIDNPDTDIFSSLGDEFFYTYGSY
ncbi:MAG: hypothetical protein GF329_16990 [Candidatus Lokiarchaeota archaeon]|nr:hypothetical protein [Candidatus Lokiarchaeota archaeon]